MRTYKRKLDGVDPERGNRLTIWKEKAETLESLPDESFISITRALIRWFCGGDDEPLSNPLENGYLKQLKEDQRRAVAKAFEIADKLKANRARGDKGRQGATSVAPALHTNTNTNTNTDTNTYTEHIAPVVDLSDEAKAAIGKAAKELNGNPCQKWHRFISEYGVKVFNEVLSRTLNSSGVRNPAAHFTAALNEYVPAPPQQPEPPPVYEAEDWSLCRERCKNCTGNGCKLGVKKPPQVTLTPPEQYCKNKGFDPTQEYLDEQQKARSATGCRAAV